MYVYLYLCGLPHAWEAIGSSAAGTTDGFDLLDMAARNHIWILCKRTSTSPASMRPLLILNRILTIVLFDSCFKMIHLRKGSNDVFKVGVNCFVMKLSLF